MIDFRISTFAVTLSTLACLLMSPGARASGGGEESPPEFNSPWGPVRPLTELASGSLGVVESSWWRKPLLLAWYRFNDKPLPAGSLDAFSYGGRLDGTDDEAAQQFWSTEAKVAAPDLAPAAELWTETRLLSGGSWDTFSNCPNAAWQQARQTLADRSRAWGVNSPYLRDWISAQHRVFARCALGPSYFREDIDPNLRVNAEQAKRYVLPEMQLNTPPAGAPLLLEQDRAYQRAAAWLYEGHYLKAEAAFGAIAQDTASPWREWGAYQALRARLRGIQVTPPMAPPDDSCSTPECVNARNEFRAFRQRDADRLLADITRALEAARKSGGVDEVRRLSNLKSLAAARLDPALRFRELADELSRPDIDAATFQAAAVDYLHLHRQFPPSEPLGEWISGLIDGRDPSQTPCKTETGSAKKNSETAQYQEARCLRSQWSQESFARYKKQPEQRAWLFSAAVHAERSDPHLNALLSALAEVPGTHPGTATFMLQRLRLGSRNDALPLAEALLKRPEVQTDYSARNRVREYRMQYASGMPEFWADALRERGTAFDRDTLLAAAPADPAQAPQWGWDYDTTWILNFELPHAALLATARNSGWPEASRRAVAEMAWARALWRNNAAQAREALALAAGLKSEMLSKPEIAQLLAIKDDQLFLQESKIIPAATASAKWGDSCRMTVPKPDAYLYGWDEYAGGFKFRFGQFAAQVLPASDLAVWRTERAALDALPDLVTLRMQSLLEFAERFPEDARVPELLHQTVYATRMNYCADKSAGKLSKKAFELLKRKYPKSEEARKTKYWFAPGG